MKFTVSNTGIELEDLILPNEEPIKRLPIENCHQDEFDTLEPAVQAMYEFDPVSGTFFLPNEQWLKCRKHGEYQDPADPRYINVAIGGSDLSALFDGSELAKMLKLYEGQHGSTYKSAIELFYEKTEQELPLKEEKNEDVLFQGHVLEPVVREYFMRVYQKDHPDDVVSMEHDPHMYQCGRRDTNGNLECPFILCDLDGEVTINGITGVFEAKSCMFGSEDYPLWKAGIVPLKYYLQCCWYMLCKNYPFAYIACLTGTTLNDLTYIYIERNFDIENEIIKMAREFVGCVSTGTKPNVSGQNVDRLYKFWRMKSGNYDPAAASVSLDETVLPTIEKLLSLGTQIDALNAQIKALKDEQKALLVENIFPSFGDANYGTVNIDDNSWYEIKLRNNGRIPIDQERLKADHPDIYDKYVSMKPSFDTTKFKKEQKELVPDYLKVENKLTDAKLNFVEINFKERKKPDDK